MPKTFHYPATGFSCRLESHRCEALTKMGDQCLRRAVIGSFPALCWNHLLKNKHLRIAPSHLPNAGKGLFVMDPSKAERSIIFRPNQLIIEYGGENIDLEELNKRYGEKTAPYGVEVKQDVKYEDAACQRGVGAISNTYPRHQNAVLKKGRGDVIKVYATKNIRNGDEIYVPYGRGYRFEEHETK